MALSANHAATSSAFHDERSGTWIATRISAPIQTATIHARARPGSSMNSLMTQRPTSASLSDVAAPNVGGHGVGLSRTGQPEALIHPASQSVGRPFRRPSPGYQRDQRHPAGAP